jgi:hypothetical protein
MRTIVVGALALALSFLVAACEQATETALVGGHEIPYGKLGMNVFPRNVVFGDATSQMADIKSMGINYVRINLWFDTLYMPTESSSPDFTRLDAAVAAAKTNNLEIVAILAYVPEWLKGRSDWKTVFQNKYLIPVVSRYKGDIDYWELWNEPDELTFNVLNGNPEDYFSFVKIMSPKIRSLDPGSAIVAAATANIVSDGLNKWNWTQTLLDLGLASYADVLNLHYYGDLEFELSGVGGDFVVNSGMRVWVTETGKTGHSGQWDYFDRNMRYIDKSLNPERIYWYCYVEGHLATDGPGIHPDDTWGIRTYYSGVHYNSPLWDHLKNR